MKKNYKIVMLKILAPMLAIVLAVLISSIVILAIDKNPLDVFYTMFKFSFGRTDSIAMILFNATPLIFSGLAASVGFRMGIFNMGIEGQYLMGTFLAALVGFSLQGLPAFIHLPLVIFSGIFGGMLWAVIPTYLKVKRNVHEVISTIMLNYISYSLIHYFIADIFKDKSQKMVEGLGSVLVRTPKLAPSALIPRLHEFLQVFGVTLPKHVYLNWFFPISLALALAVYYLINKTPLGYEIRAVGQNSEAARTAGIRPEAVYVTGFLLSGAIAGLVGLSDLTGYFKYMDMDFPRGYGFDGVAVALIGQNHPLGIVVAAMLFGFLKRGAEGIQVLLKVPMDTIVILQGLIILFIVVITKVANDYIRRLEKREVA